MTAKLVATLRLRAARVTIGVVSVRACGKNGRSLRGELENRIRYCYRKQIATTFSIHTFNIQAIWSIFGPVRCVLRSVPRSFEYAGKAAAGIRGHTKAPSETSSTKAPSETSSTKGAGDAANAARMRQAQSNCFQP